LIVFQPYKRLLSAILLSLYIFISLPVQIWHWHAPKNITQTKNPILAANVFSDSYDSIRDNDDCGICSHHYSCYHSNTLLIQQLVNKNSAGLQTIYLPACLQAVFFFFSNKSPPAAI
jgi:hypothetical protein